MARYSALKATEVEEYDSDGVERGYMAARDFLMTNERKMIEVSKETYDKLFSLANTLKKILKKPVSIDALLKVLLVIDNTDGVLVGLSEYLREESIDKGMKE
jgi:hypothetical protein